MIYEVLDEAQNVLRLNAAVSGIGFSASADAAEELNAAKKELRDMRRPARFLNEAKIAIGAIHRAAPFSARITSRVPKEPDQHQVFSDITGLEFIKSRVYAKDGRTRVNVDDNLWQPVTTRRLPNKVENNALFLSTLMRLKLGLHSRQPTDMRGRSMIFRLESDKPVKYQVDGETDEQTVLYPGQSMRLYLASIAVPVLMVR
jgi:hypothetical protein